MLRIVNDNWHPSVTAWCTIQFSLFQAFPFYCNFRKKLYDFFHPCCCVLHLIKVVHGLKYGK